MTHILSKYNESIHLFTEPFPHILIENCLDDNYYSKLSENFPDNDKFMPKNKEENQAYWLTGSDLASHARVWDDFIKSHNSEEFFSKAVTIIQPFMEFLDPNYVSNLGKELKDCSFTIAESGRGSNPLNKRTDIVISIAAGINTPCRFKSTVEPPHNDYPQKLFNSLLYMRDDDDDSTGGDLTLYQTKDKFIFTSKSEGLNWIDQKYIKEIKTIKYNKNVLVLFPQRINAIHGVTARGPTIHTRKYININMESYVLKRNGFFVTPRSTYAKIKFKIAKLLPVSFKKIINKYKIFK